MMISLKPVDTENFWDVIELRPTPEQEEWIVSNAISIAQAKVQPECIPLAIYHDDTPVGFCMYCIDRDDGEYWIYRLMIDAASQRRGYGRAALKLLLAWIDEDPSHSKIFLGVDPRGGAAVALYQSEGFSFTGQAFGKERIMCRERALTL